MSKDWLAWHRPYDEAGSPLQLRLAAVQAHIRRALGARPPGAIRVVSICAGQGRDLLEVLVDHPRRADVTAHLVELALEFLDACRNFAHAYVAIRIDLFQALELGLRGDELPLQDGR